MPTTSPTDLRSPPAGVRVRSLLGDVVVGVVELDGRFPGLVDVGEEAPVCLLGEVVVGSLGDVEPELELFVGDSPAGVVRASPLGSLGVLPDGWCRP